MDVTMLSILPLLDVLVDVTTITVMLLIDEEVIEVIVVISLLKVEVAEMIVVVSLVEVVGETVVFSLVDAINYISKQISTYIQMTYVIIIATYLQLLQHYF